MFNNFISAINTNGNNVLEVIRLGGYFIAAIGTCLDVTKNIRKQDIASMVATLIKYGAGVGILYGTTKFFDWVIVCVRG